MERAGMPFTKGRKRREKQSRRFFSLLALCSACLLLLMAGCMRELKPSATPPVVQRNVQNPQPVLAANDAGRYVGNAVCAECHPAEFNAHHGSNHDLTLRVMESDNLGKLAPPPGPIPDSNYVLKRVDAAYYLDEEPAQGYAQKLDFAFGAGRHGITFVTVPPDNKLMEMRASYFPSEHKWLPTPGLEGMPPEGMGLFYNEQKSRNCFGCHVITLPANTVVPERKFIGVGCESCHGPAGEHAAVMRKGGSLADLRIARMGTWGAKQLNDACGKCHRSDTTPNAQVNEAITAARFQPNDLELSRCFQASKDTLSCATCHNAHQNASHNQTANEAICLRCHSASAVNTDLAKLAAAKATIRLMRDNRELSNIVTVIKGNVCPVNSRAGCIGCHMPPRKIMPKTQVNYTAPDHCIRIYRAGDNKNKSQ